MYGDSLRVRVSEALYSSSRKAFFSHKDAESAEEFGGGSVVAACVHLQRSEVFLDRHYLGCRPLKRRKMKYETLVDSELLANHLQDPDWIAFDLRFSLTDPDYGRRTHAAGHVPGARFLDVEQDLSAPVTPGTGRHPLPDAALLAERFGAWGVGDGVQVVVYDDAGGGYAVRLWWLLRWLGHRAVALLDGGLPDWVSQGRPLRRGLPRRRPREFNGQPDDSQWLGADEIEQALGSLRYRLFDARASERFRGEVEPIDPVAGHIPGAANLPYLDNLDADGRFRPGDVLKKRFRAKLGEGSPESVVHMCGSGVTAVHNLLAMEIAGLSGSKLYAGSWSEWIRVGRRPVAVGREEQTRHESTQE